MFLKLSELSNKIENYFTLKNGMLKIVHHGLHGLNGLQGLHGLHVLLKKVKTVKPIVLWAST